MAAAAFRENQTVTNNLDCNDRDATIHPGAPEICGDGKDNDCDGLVDEASYYVDADGDGYGNPVKSSCIQKNGWVTNNTDCDDNDAAVYPGAIEVCDGIDNDCNGLIDEGFDTDGDGYSSCAGDCNDNDASMDPGAIEICDGKDNDCDGLIDNNIVWYRDADADGYGNISKPKKVCVQPAGYVRDSADCKDNNANINPGQTEICGNNVDDNCDGQIDEGCALIGVAPQPASVNEGNKGKSNMTFVVSLSAPALKSSKVSYQTADVTATAGTDYITKTGTLSFAKGQSSKTVVVKITGDINPEPDEHLVLCYQIL